MSAGDAKSDFWWLVIVVVVLGCAWLATGGPSRPEDATAPYLRPPAPLDTGPVYRSLNPSSPNSNDGGDIASGVRSSYFGQFSIDAGSARYEIQPNQEYITL